jgi:hypothetical protein
MRGGFSEKTFVFENYFFVFFAFFLFLRFFALENPSNEGWHALLCTLWSLRAIPPTGITHVPSREIKHNDCDFRNGTFSSVFFVVFPRCE